MAKTGFKPFPYDPAPYRRAGKALQEFWPRLHQGDREPFPDVAALTKAVQGNAKLAPSGTLDKAAMAVQEAWRAYHAGAFAEAVEGGLAVGPLGSNAANKAACIYATYVETDEARKLALFQQAAARAEALQVLQPDSVNAWYFHALAIGRYSQGISVAKALADGLAGRARASLERALKIDAKHAEAHIAFGSYHAEIVAKIGALVAGLTYGAKREAAMTHFETAVKLIPFSAVARMEYANGLVSLFGRAKMAEARKLYAEAAACEPMEAMERLDVEAAKAEL